MNNSNLIYASLFKPKSMQMPHAWIGHIPFSAWLAREVSAKLFVELGTHTGNSYFSMCQSISESKLPTKCFAVDTWQGDAHAGQYSDHIFKVVNLHNQNNYSNFSQLMRMTFDEACASFAEKSIDLLHIEGLHTYEAVKHDFESWLPKLAPGAVVLFHDTNVYDRNFGVWKLWSELIKIYPLNIEFKHSHGLGVLQLNDGTEQKKLNWLSANDVEKKNLTDFFELLAKHQTVSLEVNHLMQQVNSASDQLALREKQINEIYNSTSWKISSPLRALKQLFKS
jgi:Methyltransferase domain